MQKLVLVFIFGILSLELCAQDSTKTNPELSIIKLGNITIIKKPGDTSFIKNRTQDTLRINDQIFIISKDISKSLERLDESLEDFKKFGQSFKRKFSRTSKKISTNWFVVDLGFSGYNDQTNYNSIEAQNFLKPVTLHPNKAGNYSLKNTRVSNFSVWVFIQRLSMVKNVLNLKYGLGVESNNYFFKNGITYVDEPEVYTTDNGDIFSKNKLVANYLTVPLMLNVNTNPGNGKKAFQISAGISGGYLIGARQKQKSVSELEKNKTDFNLQQFKLAYVGEIGLGLVKVYGSYSITPLHKYGLNQLPYTVGIRLSY